MSQTISPFRVRNRLIDIRPHPTYKMEACHPFFSKKNTNHLISYANAYADKIDLVDRNYSTTDMLALMKRIFDKHHNRKHFPLTKPLMIGRFQHLTSVSNGATLPTKDKLNQHAKVELQTIISEEKRQQMFYERYLPWVSKRTVPLLSNPKQVMKARKINTRVYPERLNPLRL